MIAKHVSMRSLGKSNFAALVSYLTDSQSKDHRLGAVRLSNVDAVSVDDAISEVLATQYSNTRAKSDKTFHLVVSFRAGESPSAEVMEAIEKRICDGLGYGEHQRVSVVHNDTDNLHIHIAINKIHPSRLTIHEPYYSHQKLADLCSVLEADYGLDRDNHMPQQRRAAARAQDMERHSGLESLSGWIARECLSEIKAAQSWAELHNVLDAHGLVLRERGNGLVVVAEDGVMVKASTLGRDFSKLRLEERLGPFVGDKAGAVPKTVSPENRTSDASFVAPRRAKRYEKRPIATRVDTTELYSQYQADRVRLSDLRGSGGKDIRDRRARDVEAAKRAWTIRRGAIRILGDGRDNKRLLYKQARAAFLRDVEVIAERAQREREALYADTQRPVWADWLKQEALQGRVEAITALRARDTSEQWSSSAIRGRGEVAAASHAPVVDTITKKGTVIFRAAAGVIRDDGERLRVREGASTIAVREALLLTIQRYGPVISVQGTVEFKAQVILAAVSAKVPMTFADPALESRRIALLKRMSDDQRTDRPKHSAGRGGVGSADGRVVERPAPDAGLVNSAGRTAISAAVVRPSARNHGDDRGEGGRRGQPVAGSGAKRSAPQPHVAQIGTQPPPQSRHRLRALSALGVVPVSERGPVLLPSDVPGDMEHQGTKRDNAVRRSELADSVVPSQAAIGAVAVEKYIAERNKKRASGIDIPKHCRYTDGVGKLLFQGLRRIDGQALALLSRVGSGETMVKPVDNATAQRLTRIRVGAEVAPTESGSLKTAVTRKGKSR